MRGDAGWAPALPPPPPFEFGPTAVARAREAMETDGERVRSPRDETEDNGREPPSLVPPPRTVTLPPSYGVTVALAADVAFRGVLGADSEPLRSSISGVHSREARRLSSGKRSADPGRDAGVRSWVCELELVSLVSDECELVLSVPLCAARNTCGWGWRCAYGSGWDTLREPLREWLRKSIEPGRPCPSAESAERGWRGENSAAGRRLGADGVVMLVGEVAISAAAAARAAPGPGLGAGDGVAGAAMARRDGARIGIALDGRSGVVVASGLVTSGAAVGAACQITW